MSQVSVRAFNETLEKSHDWIVEIMKEGEWQNEEAAYSALRAVLHALRDRLPVGEATDLAAELPMLIRGVYYENWTLSHKPEKMSADEFMDRIHKHFRYDLNVSPEKILSVVLRVLERRISQGEIRHVKDNLPQDLKELWARSTHQEARIADTVLPSL